MMHGHEKSNSAIVAVKPTNKAEHSAAEQSTAELFAAEPVEPRAGQFDQGVEHSLEIEGRTADDLEHVRSGGLLLQGFPQLIEQPRILDRDDGLPGEILDQLDLLVGERPHLLPVDGDHADQRALLEHGHDEKRAGTIDQGDRLVGIFRSEVGDVDELLGVGDAVEEARRPARSHRIALLLGGPGRRSIVQRDVSEHIALVQQKLASQRRSENSKSHGIWTNLFGRSKKNS